MATIYYDRDTNPALLNGKKIAILGYGSQGHAHALNLKESGCDVRVGLYQGSSSWARAEQAGLVEGVKVRLQDERTLAVEILDGRPRSVALAEVLQLVEPNHLTLQTVQSGQNETEHAYLQLLQEEEAHGFQRFDFQPRHKDTAAEGNPSA